MTYHSGQSGGSRTWQRIPRKRFSWLSEWKKLILRGQNGHKPSNRVPYLTKVETYMVVEDTCSNGSGSVKFGQLDWDILKILAFLPEL